MTRVLFWKELREQGVVVLALAVLGAALLAANAIVNPTASGSGGLRSGDAGRFAVIMLTMAAGVVVGGTLFAGEREQKTFGYLDRLPATRAAVWPRKMLPGAVLTAGATLGFLVAGAAFGVLGGQKEVAVWAIVLAALAAGSLGWGSVGSVRSSTSIGGCGAGLVYAGLFGVAAILLGMLAQEALGIVFGHSEMSNLLRGVFGMSRSDVDSPFPAMLFAALTLFVFPYPLSWRLYTAPDRARALESIPEPDSGKLGAGSVRRLKRVPRTSARSRLVWLLRRQLFPGGLVVAVFAVAFGLTLLIPQLVIPVALVAIGTVTGLIVAITVWQDEQTSEANRFWGERRIPAGRVWAWKTGAGLLLAAVLGLLSTVPAILAAIVRETGPYPPGSPPNPFGTGLLWPGYPFVTMLFLGPVTGFAFGQIAAMLFRKAVVAAAVGLMVAGVFAAVWLPSMSGGGLRPGMAFLPALAALVTSRLLIWSWAGDRLGSPSAIARLAGGLTCAAAILAGGLGVRAFEVDPGPDPDADIVFAASLPTFDVEQAGRVLRGAALLPFDVNGMIAARNAVLDGYDAKRSTVWLPPADGPITLDDANEDRYSLERDDSRLAALAATPEWQEALVRVATMTPGVLEDPNEYAYDTQPRYLDAVDRMLTAHLALGLRNQQRGNPADFVKRFGEVLAATRTVRNKSFLASHVAAARIEATAFTALGHWLENLGDRPELLAMAQAHLQAHAAAMVDLREPRLAVQTVARKSVDAPGQWLARYLADPMQGGIPSDLRQNADARVDAEAEFQALMWAFPWEAERLRRVVSRGNTPQSSQGRARLVRGLSSGIVILGWDDTQLESHVEAVHKLAEARRNLAILALALRRSHADTGKFPPSLEALVPKYLGKVPEPYTLTPGDYNLMRRFGSPSPGANMPYRYRLAPMPEVILLNDLDPMFLTNALDLTAGRTRATAAIAGGVVAFPLEPEWDTPEEVGDPMPLAPGGFGPGFDPSSGVPARFSEIGRAHFSQPRDVIRLQAGEPMLSLGALRMRVPMPKTTRPGGGK